MSDAIREDDRDERRRPPLGWVRAWRRLV